MIDRNRRKLATIEGTHHLKVDVNRFYIKRQNGGHGLVELASAYSAAAVGPGKYMKQGQDRLTKLVQDYDAGKTRYSLQKEANLTKQEYITQETAAQNIKNQLSPALKMRR